MRARTLHARVSAKLAYFLTAVKKIPASQHGVFSLLLRKFQNEEKTDFSSFSNFFLHFPWFFSFFTVSFLLIYAEKPTKLKKAFCSFIFLFFPMLKFFFAIRKYFKMVHSGLKIGPRTLLKFLVSLEISKVGPLASWTISKIFSWQEKFFSLQKEKNKRTKYYFEMDVWGRSSRSTETYCISF